MLRAVIAICLVASVASAEDAEDPKAAIASRGIVLKAGKRSFIVIVPAATKQEHDDPSSKLWRATYYFGDSKTLFKLPTGSWKNDSGTDESIDIVDPREILSAKIVRRGESFTLQCADYSQNTASRRTFELTAADAKTAALVAKTPQKQLSLPYHAYILTRVPNTTQYIYVDRGSNGNKQSFRLFMGKRGAMKKIAVKEVALDTTALILVSAKGTLTATFGQNKETPTTVTFGSANKPQTLDLVPTWPNRQLIYTELGVYTRDRMGYPCDEL